MGSEYKESDDMGAVRYIIAGRFIDGSGADARRNVVLSVKDGILVAIDSGADFRPGDRDRIDDLSHCTILPPLVDCSVSLLQSSSVDAGVRLSVEQADSAQKDAMLKRHLMDCHAHGVLGVVDGEDATGQVQRYGKELGPGSVIEIRTSGGLCDSTNGGARIPAGGSFVRVRYSSDIESAETTVPTLSLEELYRILFHRGKKKAVVVANGPQQVEEALEAGCDAVEQGYGMGEDNLRKMAAKNVLWIPSVLRAKNGLDGAGSGGSVCCRFSLRYVSPGEQIPGAETFWKKMLAGQMAQLRRAKELGVSTAVGTGAGSVGILHGESMVEEMKLFIKAGFSLEETLHCASEIGAGFFSMEKLGILTVGRKANFLVTRGTVKQLPRKLAYLESIYINGMPSPIYSKNPSRAT